jgi:CHAD domain-containing protein
MAHPDERPVAHARHRAVGQVAAAQLHELLDAVWAELRKACARPAQAEHVHQLRVATRRALAALDAFRPVIPANRHDWLEKRLRRLRRAAGEARDLDVLAARLTHNRVARFPGRLVSRLSKQRRSARAPIRKQLDKLVEIDWPSRVDRLLADVRKRRKRHVFRDFALRRLKPVADSFFEKADRRLRYEDEIHSLRIAGKKLRYALEIFAPVLPGRSLARCQRSLEQLQETLGEFTDHASAADRFERWAHGTAAGPERDALASLSADERRQADAARKAFSQWWNSSRRRALLRRFAHMLTRSA